MSAWTIEAIEIGGGFLAGLSLRLPRGLTCIIGPRGSGKSTMAEAARYVLSGNSIPSKARADLLQANLGGGVVAPRTSPDDRGEAWVVRRQYKQPASLSSSTGRVVTSIDLDRGTFCRWMPTRAPKSKRSQMKRSAIGGGPSSTN